MLKPIAQRFYSEGYSKEVTRNLGRFYINFCYDHTTCHTLKGEFISYQQRLSPKHWFNSKTLQIYCVSSDRLLRPLWN